MLDAVCTCGSRQYPDPTQTTLTILSILILGRVSCARRGVRPDVASAQGVSTRSGVGSRMAVCIVTHVRKRVPTQAVS